MIQFPTAAPAPLPDLWIGSAYRVRDEVERQVLDALVHRVRAARAPGELHNVLTILTVWVLRTAAALRQCEVIGLMSVQIDREVCWRGQRRPWITLGDGDTKPNWFTVAARIVPLCPTLDWLLGIVMFADGPALRLWTEAGWAPLTAKSLKQALAELPVTVPRGHSGRQNLRSFLAEAGLEFDRTNAALGHQAQGREAWNIYRTAQPDQDWPTFVVLAEQYLESLGWSLTSFKESLDVEEYSHWRQSVRDPDSAHQ